MKKDYERLNEYRVIQRQIERIAEEYPELDDTGEIADEYLRAEYKRLMEEKYYLDNLIYSIADECVRAIAIRHFVFGDSYEKIGAEFVYYSKEGCRKKLMQHFEKS